MYILCYVAMLLIYEKLQNSYKGWNVKAKPVRFNTECHSEHIAADRTFCCEYLDSSS